MSLVAYALRREISREAVLFAQAKRHGNDSDGGVFFGLCGLVAHQRSPLGAMEQVHIPHEVVRIVRERVEYVGPGGDIPRVQVFHGVRCFGFDAIR